jgi:tetratricopeptide (TPR) repeat protein
MTRALALLLCALITAGPAIGQGTRASARQLHHQALEAFQKGEVERALGLFEQAFATDPVPELRLNIAQCQRALGRREAAIDQLERFVAESPTSPHRPAAEKTIGELRAAAAPLSPGPGPAIEQPPPAWTPSQRTETAPAKATPPWGWIAAGAVVVLGGSAAIFLATRPREEAVLGRVKVPAP